MKQGQKHPVFAQFKIIKGSRKENIVFFQLSSFSENTRKLNFPFVLQFIS